MESAAQFFGELSHAIDLASEADSEARRHRSGAMGHRTIRDGRGLEWQIWDTTPAKQVSHTLEAGWLTFESASEKRRLAPVPLYWLNATDNELLALLDRAQPVRRKERDGPGSGDPQGTFRGPVPA